jgi:hypothetical protein
MKIINAFLIFLILIVLLLIVFHYGLRTSSKYNLNSLEGMTSGGLDWAVYNNYFNDDVNFASKFNKWMSGTGAVDLSTLNGMTQNRITENGSQHQFSIEMRGFFMPNITGYWYFRTTSDDASYLWLGTVATSGWNTSNTTVNNGGLHGTTTRQSGALYLTANTYYPIRIQMGENWGWYDLKVEWIPPNGNWTSNGNGYLFPSSQNITINPNAKKGLVWKSYSGYMNNDVKFSSNPGSYPLSKSGIAIDMRNISTITSNQIVENVAIPGNDYPYWGAAYSSPGSDLHYWSMELVGYFLPNVTGYWDFFTYSDDASWLWLGDAAKTNWNTWNALVNNGNAHGMQYVQNTIYLVSGNYYPIRIQYGEQGGGYACRIGWRPQGGSWTCNGDGYLFNQLDTNLPESQNNHINAIVNV